MDDEALGMATRERFPELLQAVVVKSAAAFPNWVEGTVHGTESCPPLLSGSNCRESTWAYSGNDQRLVENWDQIEQTGGLYWRIATQWSPGPIERWVGDLVQKAIEAYAGQLGKSQAPGGKS
jgi:hypothetical protein